ncbi:MAG TPA: LysR family transcriptional regulator [Polyangia bacterium]
MFDWNDARYFLAVARMGSLSQAARQLRVQQSTVGRRISGLEAALKTRLFERTSDGWTPTAAGEAFVARAERIEDEALAAERQLAGKEQLVAGVVRMTAPQAFGFFFVVPLLARLHAEQPDVAFELVAENQPLNLSRREADLALRLGRPGQRELVRRKLGDVSDALYVSRAYLDRVGAVRRDELGRHAYIDFDETYPRRETKAWMAQRLRGARCVLRVNGTPGVLAAARAGMGIGLLPCWLADGDAELVRVLREHSLSQELWLVMHRDLRHAARIRVVADFFAREVQRAAPQLRG